MTITRNTTTTHKSVHKKWRYACLATVALALSACADKQKPTTEADPAVDAQTSVEQVETGVASADASNDLMINDDMANDDIAVASADEGVAIGVDDSEVLDDSEVEVEEHPSTY